MIIASARLSVAFDWGIGGLLLFHPSSFSAPLLPQLVIGDCNFVGLVGLAYSLAWLSLAWPAFFRSLFGYRFMSLLVPGNNFNWGRRFDRFSKLNWQPPLSLFVLPPSLPWPT